MSKTHQRKPQFASFVPHNTNFFFFFFEAFYQTYHALLLQPFPAYNANKDQIKTHQLYPFID